MHWGRIGLLWAGLLGPAWGADQAELDRLGEALCQSLGPLLLRAAATRDAGIPEAEAQAALAQIPPGDPDVRRWTVLSLSRVYRDRRPGAVIAEEVIGQCRAALPHR